MDIPRSSHEQQETELKVHPGDQVRDSTEYKHTHNIVQARTKGPGPCFNRAPGPIARGAGGGEAQVRLV